jgi:PIN domain nuclease of toxin-antitoxin system
LTACLDSWAVLAWLDGEEPAHGRVEQLLDDRPLISWVNAVEVYYRVERDHGRPHADEVLAGLRKTFELDLPGTALMIETARLKASTPIALGDCFAIATACARKVTLLTGDPEIVDRDTPCPVEDLRRGRP